MRRERLGMKAFAGVVIVSLVVLGLPGVAGAQTGDGAAGSAKARVFVPLTFTPVSEFLRFGGVTSGSEFGTVIVFPVLPAARVATDGARLTSTSDFGPAVFTVSGEPNAFFSITPSSGVATKDQPATSGIVTLNVSTPLTTSLGVLNTGVLSSDIPVGTATVFVGGTLEIPPNAPGGRYEAEIEVIIDYQ